MQIFVRNMGMDRRAEHLIEEGFVERQGRRTIFSRNLLDTLRRREVDTLGEKLAAQTGQPFQRAPDQDFRPELYLTHLRQMNFAFCMPFFQVI